MKLGLDAWALTTGNTYKIRDGTLLLGKPDVVKDFRLPALPEDTPPKTLEKIRSTSVSGTLPVSSEGRYIAAADKVIQALHRELRGKVSIDLELSLPEGINARAQAQYEAYEAPILAYDFVEPCSLEDVIRQICACSNICISRIEKDSILLKGELVKRPQKPAKANVRPGQPPGCVDPDDPFAPISDDIFGGSDSLSADPFPSPRPNAAADSGAPVAGGQDDIWGRTRSLSSHPCP